MVSRRQAVIGLAAAPLWLGSGLAYAAVPQPLWVIESGRSRVYLTGHTPPRPTDWTDARLEGLLGGCRALWNETNQADHADVNGLVAKYGVDAARRLQDWLSPADRARLASAIKLTGAPGQELETVRPWLAGQVLEETFYSAPGFKGRNGGQVLTAQAVKAGVPVSSEFATKADVLRWFGDFSQQSDIQYLRYVLDEILAGHEAGQRLYADWTNGRDAAAAAWIARMKRLYPDLYDVLVLERNRGWVPRVRMALQQAGSTMIVLGLYHLVGPDSVQAQLRAAGLRVDRLRA